MPARGLASAMASNDAIVATDSHCLALIRRADDSTAAFNQRKRPVWVEAPVRSAAVNGCNPSYCGRLRVKGRSESVSCLSGPEAIRP